VDDEELLPGLVGRDGSEAFVGAARDLSFFYKNSSKILLLPWKTPCKLPDIDYKFPPKVWAPKAATAS